MLRKSYRLLILPYTLVLLYLMLLGFGREQYDDHIVRFSPLISTWLFAKQSLLWNNEQSLLINIFGNILLFVPFGFLGWIFPKLNSLKILLMSFLSVLIVVEAVQYFSRMGVFDVDDLLLNTLGVCIGFWLYKITIKKPPTYKIKLK